MKLLIGSIIFLSLGCSTGGSPYTPTDASGSSGGFAGPNVIPGGTLAPLPESAPAHSYPTTTGGYITFQSIIEANVSAGESFIGAALMKARPIFLFQRSSGAGLFAWDVFELKGGTNFSRDCTLPAPAQGQGQFRNIGYDGASLVVLSSSDIGGLSLFRLDPDLCTTSFDRAISPVPVYWAAPLAFAGNDVFTDNNGSLEKVNLMTNLVVPFKSQNLPLAGSSLNPDNSSLASDGAFQLWAVSSATALWNGDIYGLWSGWAPLPYETYPALNYIKRVLVGPQGQLSIVTLDLTSPIGVLSIFQIDASHF